MHYVAYVLSMPNKGSWDGKWTGEKDVHVRCRKICDKAWNNRVTKEPELAGKSFYHDFGDGWTAKIEVKEVTEKEARALKKRSVGFAGYDWMIASLIYSGDIHYEQNWQVPFYM